MSTSHTRTKNNGKYIIRFFFSAFKYNKLTTHLTIPRPKELLYISILFSNLKFLYVSKGCFTFTFLLLHINYLDWYPVFADLWALISKLTSKSSILVPWCLTLSIHLYFIPLGANLCIMDFIYLFIYSLIHLSYGFKFQR